MILLTGSAGFLGRHLLPLLREAGEVIALKRDATATASAAEWTADLLNPQHIQHLAQCGQKIDTLIHLAGHIEIAIRPGPDGAPIPGAEDLWSLYAGNVAMTANVLGLAHALGVKHFIFASSQAVYGHQKQLPIREDAPTNALEHYAASKIACEHMLRLAAQAGISVTALRIPGLYGPQRKSGAVYNFCHSAFTSGVVKTRCDVALPWDVLHVDDAAKGFALAAQKRPEGWRCLNISSGEPCSLTILADEVSNLVPGCKVVHSGVQQSAIAMDISRAKSEIGWAPPPRATRIAELLSAVQSELQCKP